MLRQRFLQMKKRLAAFLVSVILLILPLQSTAATVVLVLSESSKVYQDFAQAFSESLQRNAAAHRLIITDTVQLSKSTFPEAGLLVAAGSRAAEAVVEKEPSAPVLLSMVPRALYDRLKPQHARMGGVFIDQPSSRYAALVKTALPEHDMVGVLAGRDSKDSAIRLLSAARDLRLRARSENVTEEAEIFPAMQKLFADGGVLLATPDTSVFNARTLPSILLSAFHRKVPVVGFSPAYVSAGAVLALYSSPEQLAQQTADLARSVLSGAGMPSAQYPRTFTVSINERVARSMGLTLDNATSIRERLERMERQP